jgi:predicted nucleotidyltransferase
MTYSKLTKDAGICKFEYCHAILKSGLIEWQMIEESGRSERISIPPRPALAKWVSEIAARVAERLALIKGIEAVALGGSHVRGTAREDSDIDLALYYEPHTPFVINELNEAACELDDRRHGRGLVTALGAWGAGVNGGGWLLIGGRHVDLLYRDLTRVRALIEKCIHGEIDAVYQLGHPLGFHNQIYAGEVHTCQRLYDSAEKLAELKSLVAVYPPRMRRALVDKHLFDAQFEIEIAARPATHGDIAYVSQCLARVVGFMVLVLYALNHSFFLNEKNAFIESRTFALCPNGFHREVERILGRLGNSAAELSGSIAAVRAVAADLRGFCQDHYPHDPTAERKMADEQLKAIRRIARTIE